MEGELVQMTVMMLGTTDRTNYERVRAERDATLGEMTGLPRGLGV